MGVMYWWFLVLWAVILVALGILYKTGRLSRLARQQKAVRVAHGHRITELPEYRKVYAQYRRLLMIFMGCLLIGIVASAFLSARPSVERVVSPAQMNRDIMLCLDVSKSMKTVDSKLVENFEQLVRDFQGQRIGLDIFNNNSSQVFPPTDDYTLVREQLAYTKKMLSLNQATATDDQISEYYTFMSGTSSFGMNSGGVSGSDFPASNVGLGLTGCIQRLGDNQSGRSQSIILATDNELGGEKEKAVILTPQAMMLAKQKGIRVYSIDPGPMNLFTETPDPSQSDNYLGEHAILKTNSILTGGDYYRLGDNTAISSIITKISSQEAKLFSGDSELALADAPLLGFVILLSSVLCAAFVSWRLKL